MTGLQGLMFAEQDNRLLARVEAADDRPQLDEATLRALLQQAGYGQWFLQDGALATLLARYNTAPIAFELTIGERRDASFLLDIAKDASCVWINVEPARGGKPLTCEAVKQALQEAGVVFGIDDAALPQVCQVTEPAHVLVASGTTPVHGEDAQFKLLVNLARDRAPKVNADGLIDFREHGDIPSVEVGTPLMRRIPATAGVDGRDVRGSTLAATPGQDHPFADKLAGVAVSADDSNVLVATLKGQPVCVDHGVLVEQLLTLGHVDMDCGNITYDGSVRIDGDVMSGMKVHVSGDISVTGTVEGGELEAGGNIQVGAGIIAHAKVKAAGSVSARFVENSQISAGTVIAIDDMALQSDLQALNQIMVGVKSPQRGRLVGGSARSMMLVSTPMLGAESSGVTAVQVGVNPVLEARHHALGQRIEKQGADQENLKKVVKHLVQTGDKNGMLPRAKASWQQALQLWARSLQEKEELEQQLALFRQARVEIGLGVAGTVDLVFGKQSRRLQRPFDAGVFSIDEGGHIVFTGKGAAAVVVH